MRNLLFLSILLLPTLAWSAKNWKIVAETTVCDEKIQVMAKDGEKFVEVINGTEKRKLFSRDGTKFHEESMQSTEFVSVGEPTYTFIQPGYVEANPPKIDVSYSGEKKRCRMKFIE